MNNLKKVVYLANKYSEKNFHGDKNKFIELQRRNREAYVGGQLRKKYPNVAFILPIANSAAMADICSFSTGFSEWEGDDYSFVFKSDEVWVLASKDYKTSTGVVSEINFAKTLNIPVKYIHPETLEFIDETNT